MVPGKGTSRMQAMTPAWAALEKAVSDCCCRHGPTMANCRTGKDAVRSAARALVREAREEVIEQAARLAECAHGAGAHTKAQIVIATAIRRLAKEPSDA